MCHVLHQHLKQQFKTLQVMNHNETYSAEPRVQQSIQ